MFVASLRIPGTGIDIDPGDIPGIIPPGGGPRIPGTPVGAGACAECQRCLGLSTGGLCFGTCLAIPGCQPGGIRPPGLPIGPPQRPEPPIPHGPGGFTCGPGEVPRQIPGQLGLECVPLGTNGNGKGRCGNPCSCGHHLNKSEYCTKGGIIPKGSKCVKKRRRNFANGPAAMRAASRVAGTMRMLKRLEKSLPKAPSRGRSRSSSAGGQRSSCSCKN